MSEVPRPKGRRRLNLSVEPALQAWLIKRFMVIIFLGMALGLGTVYLLGQREIGSTFYQAHIRVHRFSELLLPAILASAALSLLTSALLLLFLPQRIAGPLHRMARELRRIAAGDLTVRIRLRKDDPGFGLPESINHLVEGWSRLIRELRQEVEALKGEWEGSGEGARKRLERLEARLGGFRL